ncbi:DNA primase [Dermatobacter hominis]|uniref:DNA primase n=1 Tax=Dermatobacter hominis TaxID=2884263 RepID=UPI001D0F4D46|nr:DNA primase [Dermatobacter hominis]UDY35810.1 DNA primase [Dermatobacter hominis]
MGIVDEDIARVRESTDIVAVISGYTQLKRVGQRWSGLCPFHNEKSPSFSVNQSEGLYHCFGCKASGDAITFVREVEHLDFPGAVEWLAAKSGVTLRYTEKDESEGRKRQARLYGLTEQACEWYHQRLRSAPDAAAARSYLRSRGFDGEEVAHFRVGWAPDDWDSLVRSLKASREDLEAAGLGFVNRRNRMQDFFRGRILFPILDERERVIGFGGRKLPDAEGPKYQNSRDNVLYNKSKALYAINWAKADAVANNQVLVCEGYTDVIGFARAGVQRAVATCGTALTEDHVRILKRFTRNIVLAYDADEAGQSAAERVYAWEQAHDIQFSVVSLPPGTDPDELARSDPQALHAAVDGPRPFLEFRVSRVLGSADLSGPEGRARAAEAALEVVAEHPDPLVRDQYVMELADTCRIDAAQLRSRLEQVIRSPRPRRDEDQGRRRGAPPAEPPPEMRQQTAPRLPPLADGVEREVLRLAVNQPDLAAPFLDESFFRHPTARASLDALLRSDTLAQAIEESPPEVAELLAELAVEEPTSEPPDVLARFASEVGRRELAELEAEARSSSDPLAYSDVVAWLKVTLDQLRHPRAEVEIVAQLLAFLRDRHQQ